MNSILLDENNFYRVSSKTLPFGEELNFISDFPCVIFVKYDGVITVNKNGETTSEIHFIPSGMFCFLKSANKTSVCELFIFEFKDKPAIDLISKSVLEIKETDKINDKSLVIIFDFIVNFNKKKQSKSIKNSLRFLYCELGDRGILHELFNNEYSDFCRGINDFFNKRFDSICDISSACGYFGISRSTLYRKLKCENLSYKKLLNEFRLNKAISIISSGSRKSLLDVALDSGFNSYDAFNKNFTKFAGMTPGKYKKLLKEQKRGNNEPFQ
ncbi:TPA: helix-turn-helix domain-containing protein [Vibrio vulnificus]